MNEFEQEVARGHAINQHRIAEERYEKSGRTLAQEGDKVWERNLAILVGRGAEVLVSMTNNQTYKGYVSALDEYYMQICRTDQQQTQALLNRDQIVALEETGMTLKKLEETNQEKADRIKEKVDNFIKVSKTFNRQRTTFR